MNQQINAIIVLGGGRYGEGPKKGELTPLSTNRLDAGAQLFKDLLPENPDLKIIVTGENKSTYSPKAIFFPKPGCELRQEHLINQQIPKNDIAMVNGGIDTISEAFVTRSICQQLGIKNVLPVSSINHEPRALWIFKRIFGNEIQVEQPGEKYLCQDGLNPQEEAETFKLTQEFFLKKFGYHPIPNQNLETWFENNRKFYEAQSEIHNRYPHNEAYFAGNSGRKEI